MKHIAELIGSSLLLTRRLTQGLLPVRPIKEGLASALVSLAKRTRELYCVSCRCTIVRPSMVHNNTKATHLYYIAQEAVTNAARHSGASRISVRLRVGEKAGRLTVTDNGKGLPADARRGPGMGLRIMEHRATMIGGVLSVKPNTRTAGGTQVTCTFENLA